MKTMKSGYKTCRQVPALVSNASTLVTTLSDLSDKVAQNDIQEIFKSMEEGSVACPEPKFRMGRPIGYLEDFDVFDAAEIDTNLPLKSMVALSFDYDPNKIYPPSLAHSAVTLDADTITFFYQAKTFGHDFTCIFLTKNDPISIQEARRTTDCPLKNIKRVNDGCNDYTPDVIMMDKSSTSAEGKYVVIEYATTKSHSEKYLNARFLEKKSRYIHALNQRINLFKSYDQEKLVTKIIFIIIVVNPLGVYTNIDLSESTISEMLYRFSSYDNIVEKLRAKGWTDEDLDRPDSFRRTDRTAHVKAILSSIQVDLSADRFFEHPVANEKFYDLINENPDPEYVKRQINKIYHLSFRDIVEENYLEDRQNAYQRNLEKNLEAINLTKEIMNNNSSSRKDFHKKSIIHIPFIIPYWHLIIEEKNTIMDFPNTVVPEGSEELYENPHIQLFRRLKDSLQCGFCQSYNEDPEEEERIALSENYQEEEKKAQAKRHLYRRLKISIDDDKLLKLATFGVGAKQFKDKALIKDTAKFSKENFSLNAFTDDINDALMNSPDLLFIDLEDMDNDYVKFYCDLYKDSSSIHVENEKGNEFPMHILTSIISTKGFQWCKMITEIGCELSLSFRQHTKNDQFIVKKLRSSMVYIIIRSNGLRRPLFYSLVFPKEGINEAVGNLHLSSIFKNVLETKEYYFTEFSSVNSEKISNFVKAESTFMTLLSYWAEFYGICYYNFDSGVDYINTLSKHSSLSKMLMLSLMVFLENKATTEEIITLSRFMIMEGFVSLPISPKPYKIFKKISGLKMRSRLQVWLVNKMFDLSTKIVSHIGYAPQLKIEQIAWRNLSNPYTGDPVESPWHMINLMYLGYLKDKNEKAEKNTIGHLYEKILALEDDFPETYDYLGLKDPEEPKRHEFSPSMVKYLVDFCLKKLDREKGGKSKQWLEATILHNLSFKDLLETATLKASSRFSQEWYDYNDQKVYTRPRVLEKINELLLMKASEIQITHVIDLAKECLEHVEQSGAMHICLFKKNQHGGLREIYVLGICERIIQLIIETISKSICSLFSSETMTNPGSKTTIPTQHNYNAKKSFKEGFRTVGCSADAEKWNQGHYVTKFMIMLCRFTPSYMHGIILRGLKLFLKKRIMIDFDLIKIFIHNEDLNMGDTFTHRMKECFLGRTTEKWMKKDQCYIETESGMMQGILHYTSSLYHTIYQEWLKDITSKCVYIVTEQFDECHELHKRLPITSVLQSSDDSAVMVSYPILNKKYDIYTLLAINIMFKFKANFGKTLGIYDSVKTTAGTLEIMEFNSEFYFSDSQIRPTLRWVAAALTITERESLCGRQEELSTSLTSVISGGGSFSLTAMIQISQMLIHYRMLGLGTNPLFYKYYKELKAVGDPSLGFFLLDNHNCAGLLGFNYNLYRVITRPDKYSLHHSFSFSLRGDKEQYNSVIYRVDKPGKVLEMTTSNSLVHTRLLRLGDRVRWSRLVENMQFPNDWREYIEENPMVLYREAENIFEVRVKLAVKVHAPGVAESLSQANAVVNTIATCAYAISRHVITDYGAWDRFPDADKMPSHYKISLLQRLVNRGFHERNVLLSESQLFTLFPHIHEYREYDAALRNLPKINLVRYYGRLQRKNSMIPVLENLNASLVSPISLLKWKWFDSKDILGHPSKLEEHFRDLQGQFLWLSSTPEETLRKSPFVDHIQLQNFFSRLESKPREVVISGAPVRVVRGTSNFFTAIRRNFFPGLEISKIKDTKAIERIDDFKRLTHHVRMIQTYPFKDDFRRNLLESCLAECKLEVPHHKLKQHRQVTMKLMSDISKREPEIVKYRGQDINTYPVKMADWRILMDQKIGFWGTFDQCLTDAKVEFTEEQIYRLQVPQKVLDEMKAEVSLLKLSDVDYRDCLQETRALINSVLPSSSQTSLSDQPNLTHFNMDQVSEKSIELIPKDEDSDQEETQITKETTNEKSHLSKFYDEIKTMTGKSWAEIMNEEYKEKNENGKEKLKKIIETDNLEDKTEEWTHVRNKYRLKRSDSIGEIKSESSSKQEKTWIPPSKQYSKHLIFGLSRRDQIKAAELKEEDRVSRWLGLIESSEINDKKNSIKKNLRTKATVDSQIAAMKLYYESKRCQRFRTKFRGSRVYRGYFGSDQFIITLVTIRSVTHVTQIEYSNSANLNLFLQQLSIRANEIGFVNRLSFPDQKARLSADPMKKHQFTGYSDNFRLNDRKGAPVYIMPLKDTIIMSGGRFFFDNNGHYLKLKLMLETNLPLYYEKIEPVMKDNKKVKLEGRELVQVKLNTESTTTDFTVLTLATRESDVSLEPVELYDNVRNLIKNPHRAWIENTSVPVEMFERFMFEYYLDDDYEFKQTWKESPKVDTEKLFTFIKDRFEAFQGILGIKRGITKMSDYQPANIVEFSLDAYEEILNDPAFTEPFDAALVLKELGDDGFSEDFDDLYAEIEIIQSRMFDEIDPIEDLDLISSFIPNRWLDLYCNEFLRMHGGLIEKIQRKYRIMEADEKRANFIARLLGYTIPPENIVRTRRLRERSLSEYDIE